MKKFNDREIESFVIISLSRKIPNPIIIEINKTLKNFHFLDTTSYYYAKDNII